VHLFPHTVEGDHVGQKNHGGGRTAAKGTGTKAKKRTASPAPTPGNRSVKGGPRRNVTGKHAAAKSQGARTSQTRKAGPKKTARRSTTRSGDK
jgi:hypothetical protein